MTVHYLCICWHINSKFCTSLDFIVCLNFVTQNYLRLVKSLVQTLREYNFENCLHGFISFSKW
jgi:hypothetical protein